MPKVSVLLDGVVLKEVELTKARTTLGRRPYNDIVIEHLTVSGEHAALHLSDGAVTVEDLNSTNGTYLDAKAVKTQLLQHGDVLELGKFKIRFESEPPADDFEKTMVYKRGSLPLPPLVRPAPAASPAAVVPAVPARELQGWIKVLSGTAAGREMALTKVVTTVGKPAVSVAAITQRRHGYWVHHVEGMDRILVNGIPASEEPTLLKHGDQIVLAGTQMQFLLR
ncbi:MAG: FHA domain-containing protein [Rhodoferax sp.]|uniref:FHA domain-containing protein n=1 Tax=Rhodoferax sp. TaxID=50421 RepID=UPI001B541F0B|nr:FHA domain-containing protein [Rhodoferax sp.]MBP9904028.1 FHA domain-containing protein [Rhodoferax sp.]